MAKQPRRTSVRRFRRRVKARARYTKRRGRVLPPLRVNRRKIALYRNPLAATRWKTQLHYNTVIQLNPNANAVSGAAYWVFSANGCYDPDITSTGHQPLYFDNYMAVYQKYRVNYSKIMCTVINHTVNTDTGTGTNNTLTTTPNYSYKLAIVCDRSSTEFHPGLNTVLEDNNPLIKWRFISPSLTGKLPKLYHFCSPHKLLNMSFHDDTLIGTVATNPSGAANYQVLISSSDGVTDPPSVYVNVRITYWVEFFDRLTAVTEN